MSRNLYNQRRERLASAQILFAVSWILPIRCMPPGVIVLEPWSMMLKKNTLFISSFQGKTHKPISFDPCLTYISVWTFTEIVEFIIEDRCHCLFNHTYILHVIVFTTKSRLWNQLWLSGFLLSSCMFIDPNGATKEIDLKVLELSKADPLGNETKDIWFQAMDQGFSFASS